MPKETLSDFEESNESSKNWPGYCQLVKDGEIITLNFSRVPMRTLPPRPRGCTLFTTHESALKEAIERVSALPNNKGNRSNKILQPSHISIIHEASHAS